MTCFVWWESQEGRIEQSWRYTALWGEAIDKVTMCVLGVGCWLLPWKRNLWVFVQNAGQASCLFLMLFANAVLGRGSVSNCALWLCRTLKLFQNLHKPLCSVSNFAKLEFSDWIHKNGNPLEICTVTLSHQNVNSNSHSLFNGSNTKSYWLHISRSPSVLKTKGSVCGGQSVGWSGMSIADSNCLAKWKCALPLLIQWTGPFWKWMNAKLNVRN